MGVVPLLSAGTFEATLCSALAICRRYDRPRVLDVGCGAGELLVALAPAIEHGSGVDVSEAALVRARRRASRLDHVAFHRAPVERLPASLPAPFDVIFFVGSIEHMADARTALAAARERTHARGRIVVVAIAPGAPHAVVSRWMLRGSETPVVQHLGVRRLRAMATEAGLRVEEVRPLYRGSRQSRPGRALSSLLRAYDRLGGPTCAVVLKPTSSPIGSGSSAR